MSELALKLIAKNKRTKAKFLDLGKCGLTAVPEEIGELVWLEELSLASRLDEGKLNPRLSDIRVLSRLRGLRRLNLRKTDVSDISPLACLKSLHDVDLGSTSVSNVGSLAGLTCLQKLYLNDTPVSDVGPLAGLTSLRTLDLSRTNVSDVGPLAGLTCLQQLYIAVTGVSDVGPLAGLKNLHTLSLSGTRISDVGPLASLTVIERLTLWRTRVSDTGPLAKLTRLERLDLSFSMVSDIASLIPLVRKGLPVRLVRHLDSTGIFVQGCRLSSPPPEILQQGNKAILNYFEERHRGEVDHLYEAKLLIIGEGEAGKTSLLRRLFRRELPLPEAKDSTKGIEIYPHEFPLRNGRTFRLNVWDFGGQEIYHATHQFFLTRRSLYVLVDDTGRNCRSVSDKEFKYWLDLVDVFGGRSPVLIFQNEKSGRSKQIDMAGIKGQFENVISSHAGDLEPVSSTALDQFREAIEFHASHLSHIGDELPARWIEVRGDIEKTAAEEAYISQKDYFEIYSRHMPFDREKALHLSRYFHDLGVFLHYLDDPLLARTVILQNEWATTAVFRVLDDEQVKRSYGRFTEQDCLRLWRDTSYADMHPELLALMQKFELCYELRDTATRTWLATQLLPSSKPAELEAWGQVGDLVLRYRYDFLPKGIVSRLVVRLNRYVSHPKQAWVSGALFEQNGSAVLVELLASGNEIELRGRGLERKDLLCTVAADLDALNDSFSGLKDKVDKLIPCNCTVCSEAKVPQFYAQKKLLKRKQAGETRVQCEESYKWVDVLELLDGIRIPQADERSSAVLRTVRIFLASSSELRADRDEFERYFLGRNKELVKDGILLEIVRWEEFLDAVSATRLQDEYNKAIRECDICLCLFATNVGKYTEEEFNVAYGQFKARGLPRVWTYFKDAALTMGTARKEDLQSVWAFQERLDKLGHFHSQYKDIADLKLRFRDQLDLFLRGAGTAAGA